MMELVTLKYLGIDILQSKTMFKYNTDTALLGHFMDPMKNKSLLDIGTNNGALLFYGAAMGASELRGADVFKEALDIARMNLEKQSVPFSLYEGRIQDLDIPTSDVLVCNPPFFEMNNVTDDPYFRTAMFEESLPLKDLFDSFRRLMKDNGEVYMIYPADRFPELYNETIAHKMKIMKMQFVHDTNKPHALRVLVKMKIGPMTKLKILEPVMIDKGKIL